MSASPLAPAPPPASSSSSASESKEEAVKEEQNQEQQKQEAIKECMHKTKTIQFLGRTTPIILQNDNGPCPLLAICNVLFLRNNLNLSPDVAEVSQEKLLSLVAERLIDSNSNINDKDVGYVENQQQNIADAIDLLPRLATGIDVNIKFRRIDDFEFTPECAIFDLLDIPLYHGWIVDPQDYETANVIGSKSYNAIMGELVALESQTMEHSHKNNSEDCVDFAAATTATLGVPSPSLSKTRSFDDSPSSVSGQQSLRKRDLEEEADLLRVLKSSEGELPTSVGDAGNLDLRSCTKNLVSADSVDTQVGDKTVEKQNLHLHERSISDNSNTVSSDNGSKTYSETITREEFSKTDGFNQRQLFCIKPEELIHSNDVADKNNIETMVIKGNGTDELIQIEDAVPISPARHGAFLDVKNTEISPEGENIETRSTSGTDAHEILDNLSDCDKTEVSSVSLQNADSNSSSGRIHHADVAETFTSSIDGSEPIYEGEECIFESVTPTYEDREPIYEGEVILAKQADKRDENSKIVRLKDEITPKQGELIGNFLKNTASQLTFYGLFCLQDGLKERELCVFFRNNHFSAMFKYDGELYLLATDQGYLNQPDLVWEKLNEVNGDTIFMTGNFKEFKVDSHASGTWDEQSARASTADYIASIDNAAQAGFDITSDLQLAIALQQQEFEQQPPRQAAQQPQPQTQPSVLGSSRLVTGPQVPRDSGRGHSSSSSKQDAKSKDKCIVM